MNNQELTYEYENKDDQAIVNLNLTDCSKEFITRLYYSSRMRKKWKNETEEKNGRNTGVFTNYGIFTILSCGIVNNNRVSFEVVKMSPKSKYAHLYKKSVTCNICGRVLTNPASIKRGFGRECWEKLTNQGEYRKVTSMIGRALEEKGYVWRTVIPE